MKRMMTALTAALLAGIGGCASTLTDEERAATLMYMSSPDGVEIDEARIDAVLQEFVDKGEVKGASALVWFNGEEAYYGAFGMADPENDRPMARDTIVQIFSMTKPIAGVAFMQMYEAGHFKLDDKLSDHLPEFADVKVWKGMDADGNPIYGPPERPITIADITRHTAGFVGGGGSDSPPAIVFAATDPTAWDNTLPEFSEAMADVPLLYEPGTRWLYSSVVDVQARLVEKYSGQLFEDYLQEHILGPLGMDDTSYVVPEDKRDRRARVYFRDDETGDQSLWGGDDPCNWPCTPYTFRGGSWGLSSTLDDYMTFALMLQSEGTLNGVTFLKPETVALMATDHLPPVEDKSWLPNKGTVGFGIDFAVRIAPPQSADEASGAVGEFFWDGAASTVFWVDPNNDLTAVMFVQVMPFDRVQMHKRFRDAVYAGSAAAAPVPEPVE